MKLGIDIGSTTLKCVLLDDHNKIVYHSYERHLSMASEKLTAALNEVKKYTGDADFTVAISGSAGMGIATAAEVDFVQEVYATKVAISTLQSGVDAVIELGGEDAKVLFLTDGLEVRMNGSCAGGTGAFIDQMATLLHITPTEMNELSADHQKIYSVASRCGVFAKSDIQPLLNQGAKKEDISASIFHAVVNQTVAGLAQGREIDGKVVYLGGPLTFMSQLRAAFDKVLGIEGLCPENSLYYVAMGTALMAKTSTDVESLLNLIAKSDTRVGYETCAPLFTSKEEYDEFSARHATAVVKTGNDNGESGVFIGIDSGSTTVKMVAINQNDELLFTRYASGGGNPITVIKGFLEEFYNEHPSAKVLGSAVTGYGEEMMREAFRLDFGIVETVAHFMAAKKFNPNVDFIIDIGGQDIKCFRIKDGNIDDIFLNEACSSGCGSFLQSFASVLGYSGEEFARLGLFADAPVDLGSRCTVFMNSSVKQAQKDGASVENISAGLSISVVKNALYKVIRAVSAAELGENIVVQGGTFLSDAVLRAFEKEIGSDVIRPNISGMMGAYGAALYAKNRQTEKSDTITAEGLRNFTHTVKSVVCHRCTNACTLTVNSFADNRKFIGGNRCDKPVSKSNEHSDELNLYAQKEALLAQYMQTNSGGARGKIGLPMVLNMYELLPFWSKFFETLGFEVMASGFSDRALYVEGQHTIPSDTVCYPAKLVHGHIERLLKQGVDAIFYPCMTYNIDEKRGDNHYNCPVVAYYPEVVHANIPAIEKTKFIYDYIGIHRPADFAKSMTVILSKSFGNIPLAEVKKATDFAFAERDIFIEKTRQLGEVIIQKARAEGKKIIVLAGRPYHLDPEINHGIDRLVNGCGVALVTEDAVCHHVEPTKVSVLNQWTYHSRLYDAASYTATQKDMELVQLVSFGCGVDAITTDEVRAILHRAGKIYTQIKIDEITNLGAVKIRVRSLLATI